MQNAEKVQRRDEACVERDIRSAHSTGTIQRWKQRLTSISSFLDIENEEVE
jgi:hypothetical protein